MQQSCTPYRPAVCLSVCLSAVLLVGCAAKRNYDEATGAPAEPRPRAATAVLAAREYAQADPARAQFESAWQLLDAGQYAAAEAAFARWLGEHRDHALAPEAMLFAGLARQRLGRPDEAARTYRELIDRHPASPAADAARRRLEP